SYRYPYHRAECRPTATRCTQTRTHGTGIPPRAGRSETTAQATLAAASAACYHPSAFSPRTATKSSPGPTVLESWETPVISRSRAAGGELESGTGVRGSPGGTEPAAVRRAPRRGDRGSPSREARALRVVRV